MTLWVKDEVKNGKIIHDFVNTDDCWMGTKAKQTIASHNDDFKSMQKCERCNQQDYCFETTLEELK